MIVKLSEKEINKALDYICKLGELSTDKELYKAINVILDMADTLRDNDMVAELCRAHFDTLRDEILEEADVLGFDLYSGDDNDKYNGYFSDFLKILLDCYENEMKYIG